MQAFTTHRGIVVPMDRANVDTDAILPKQFMKSIERTGFGPHLFDGLRSPRKELLGQLLSCCTSVKTVRLFLTWARETQVVDVNDLLERHPLRTGSEKRWMSRLADGTLLSLNPHG